jgi:hypothetical protein
MAQNSKPKNGKQPILKFISGDKHMKRPPHFLLEDWESVYQSM